MQRLLRRAGRNSHQPAPVLEINPRHKLIANLAARAAAASDLTEAASLLLDLARIQDGEPPRDPAAFARQMERAMLRGDG
jgi:molecular chaperone HtpG